jgi:hypothetical protein
MRIVRYDNEGRSDADADHRRKVNDEPNCQRKKLRAA